MNRQELKAFAKEAAKSIKTSDDLNQFSQMLKKITIEAAFNAEMDEHLGYQKHHILHQVIAVMVRAANGLKPKMASLNSPHRVTVMAFFSLSWSKR